jgi:bifunctional UDP-N-acetylglucosamine pyrophosphorylase/glucosamine-1-phosphate N-acetyltransferase
MLAARRRRGPRPALLMNQPTTDRSTAGPDPLVALREQVEKRLAECARLVEAGVTVIDPATTYVAGGVSVGEGTVIHPNTTISGETSIGSRCTIGPNAVIVDSRIGDGCVVVASMLEGAVLEDSVDVGPFSHLRRGTHLEAGVHVGNFVEVKASRLGAGTKAGHFSYIGDAEVGENVNIGAGTITCNYDGKSKSRTVIGDNAFIGSDTMLVAPVTVGRGASTGAGAVVTRDVAEGDVVAGVPARPVRRRRQVRKKLG